MNEQEMEEIKNSEEYTSDLQGQSSHRGILCWGGRDRDAPNSSPVIKIQSIGYALTHKRESFYLLFCTIGLATLETITALVILAKQA